MARGGRGGGRTFSGGKRGGTGRKYGLSLWAGVWMNDNFDYFYDLQYLREFRGSEDEVGLLMDIDEMYEYAEKWEDIANMMGGTVFLDECEDMATELSDMAYDKAEQFEEQLEQLEEEDMMEGLFGF